MYSVGMLYVLKGEAGVGTRYLSEEFMPRVGILCSHPNLPLNELNKVQDEKKFLSYSVL